MMVRLYQEGDTFLHRINPVVKLAAFALLTLVPTMFFDPATPAAFLGLAVLMGWLMGGVSPLTLGRRLLPLLLVAVGLTIFNTLAYGGTRVHLVVQLGPMSIYGEALAFGASIALRILCVASFSALFVFTTDPSELVASLIQQGRMSYRVGYAMLAAYRFLPILLREMATIKDAHSVRGAYAARDPLARLKRIRRYGVPLLANGIRQAERLAVAMDARGFGALPVRTYYTPTSVARHDYLFLLACFLATCIILVTLAKLGLLYGFMGGIAESVGGPP